ncbi:response regulator [Foetidibacter luteolus]|uniref:response regulator n=1 Tax=Foetidibacter luteolus TaxID=2608880 RepID=UPI00129A8F10|nr:response regulator [Foetidibacter luteolus]
MKILAADDQPLILKSISNKLQSSGYEVFCAGNGKDAIRLYDEHQPDLVITDLGMPVVTGVEVIHHIRNVKKQDTPIIVMSGREDEDTIVNAFKMGVDDYIEKPVGVKEVQVRIQRLFKHAPLLPFTEAVADNHVTRTIQKKCIGVVIPCYNEERRLLTKEFSDFVYSNLGYHLCFVNDGSKDNTLAVLESLSRGHEDSISVYNCPVNGGKAEAVRQGMLHLAKDEQFDYIGYLDADLSTDFKDFDELVKTIESSSFKIVSGSRISRMGANITKNSAREIISKAINMLIRRILGMSFQDTQCGAKVMTREVAENVFNKKFITRWLFDVEIFLRMKKYYGEKDVQDLICEQPLKRWIHADGSKLSMKDSLKIVSQLGHIAIHYR